MWMLKIYYEQKSFEQALSLIDTFSHFLYTTEMFPKQIRRDLESF
jgi:hypothetical protein